MDQARTLRARHKVEARELILAAAREAFVREGRADFTMRELAGRPGCPAGAIYLHFAGKDDLLYSRLEESVAKLLDVLAQAPVGTDPTANVKAKVRAYVEFGLHYPHHYYVAFLLPPAARTSRDAGRPTPHEAFDVLRRSVGECRSRGRMPDVDEETASQALWAAVHGLTSLLIAKPSFPWVEKQRLIEVVIATAVDGLDDVPVSESRRGVRHDRGKFTRREQRCRRGELVVARGRGGAAALHQRPPGAGARRVARADHSGALRAHTAGALVLIALAARRRG